MKKIIFSCLLIVGLMSTIKAQEVIKLTKDKSSIHWAGAHSFGFGKHDGTVDLKSGELTMKGGKVTGGEFTLDMNTIVNTDGDYNEGLIDHLKSDDFFSTEQFPISKLIVTKVHYYDPNNTPGDPVVYFKVNADLVIKGISQPIEFDATTNDQHTEIKTRFKIDRTLWGIKYQSKGFAEYLKNNIISDAIEFEISLKID